jgi:hypothetical protein
MRQAGRRTAMMLSAVTASASKAVWLGEVEAPDEAAATEKGAAEKAPAEFKVPVKRLMAIRR